MRRWKFSSGYLRNKKRFRKMKTKNKRTFQGIQIVSSSFRINLFTNYYFQDKTHEFSCNYLRNEDSRSMRQIGNSSRWSYYWLWFKWPYSLWIGKFLTNLLLNMLLYLISWITFFKNKIDMWFGNFGWYRYTCQRCRNRSTKSCMDIKNMVFFIVLFLSDSERDR